MNNLIMTANLVFKPTLRMTAAGKPYCLARVAENIMVRNPDATCKKDAYIQQGKRFYNLACYDGAALTLAECEKGQQLFLQGRMNTHPGFHDQFIASKVVPGPKAKPKEYKKAA